MEHLVEQQVKLVQLKEIDTRKDLVVVVEERMRNVGKLNHVMIINHKLEQNNIIDQLIKESTTEIIQKIEIEKKL